MLRTIENKQKHLKLHYYKGEYTSKFIGKGFFVGMRVIGKNTIL
jgi:hypothetical protein